MAKSLKPLQIVSSKIVVTKHSDGSLYFNHKAYGILPGCRTKQLLSTMPCYLRIVVRPLFEANGEAVVDPKAWADLIKASPVVSEKIACIAVEITPEIVKQAREDRLASTTCPAVTATKFGHPDYHPDYNELVMPAV